MDDRLRAGIAIFNAGGYHEAHDAWESYWLDLEAGTDDELFLHGLIQYTATIYHGTEENWTGLQGLAKSAREYLVGLSTPYRGVALDPVNEYLDVLADDPEYFERRDPPLLTYRGETITPADLVESGDFEAVEIIASVLAETNDAYDESIVASAIEFARSSIDKREDGTFVSLVFDFVVGDERDLVYQRMASHVSRRQNRERDVEGLFEPY